MHDPLDRAAREISPAISLALTETLHSWALLDCLPIGVYVCDEDGTLVQYNRCAVELWGSRPKTGEKAGATQSAFDIVYALDGTPLAWSERPMAEALRTGQSVRDRELVIARPDGKRLSVLVNVDPLLDWSGRIIGGIGCFQDISEYKRTRSLISEHERSFRALLDALPAAVYTTDPEGKITFYNEAAVELWGVRPKLGSDQWCGSWRLYHLDGRPMRHDECPMAIALKEKRLVRGGEAFAERPDGTRIPFMAFPTPFFDHAGTLTGAVNMLVDSSAQKRAAAQQNALIDELNHRVKNTLATVQSLAAHTIAKTTASRDIREVFEARLFALSRAHDQLSRERWESADLRLIAEDILAPYRSDGDGEQLLLRGGSVRLGPRAALALAMVLHELATNAAKYGALSAPAGKLELRWAVVESDLERNLAIEWREYDGPAVLEPSHKGFGTKLVERSIVGELKGTASIVFDPAGFHCSMTIPLSASAT